MSLNASRLRFWAVSAWLVAVSPAFAQQAPTAVLIPRPSKVTAAQGSFVLDAQAVIRAGQAEAPTARILKETFAKVVGLDLHVQAEPVDAARAAISLSVDPGRTALGKEGYTLEVTPQGIRITAADNAGLFYGVQTLLQMLPPMPVPGRSQHELACVSIEDSPRFAWRGYMLDSSRHFVTKATVLRLLDALAAIKINVFHWHLVDDQAWRLDIAKYPQLVKPAAISDPSYTQAMGYYTPADVAEIVARAKRLHITIVPEIEMPSHATQAASMLTEASCLDAEGKPLPAGATREICLGSDKAIEQLQDILLETMAMFPDSPYIHLGGDEAEDRHWKACLRCRKRMADLGLKDPRLLQKWFMEKMSRFVHEHGRTSVAWADRLALGVPKGQVVHAWHAGELEEAVAKGFRAICSQHDYTYFDYGQGPGDSAFGGAALDVARVYSLDPTRGLTPEQARLVLGPQAQLWTELITDDQVFAKTFPRILALAEVGWTAQEQREPAEFDRRLRAYLPRLEGAGIEFFAPAVQLGTWEPKGMSEEWKELDWDVTAAVKKAGPLNVQFLYQKGLHALEIESAVLLEDGREISRDAHLGRTGAGHERNTYSLTVEKLTAGAKYTLRARVRSLGGSDSSGVLLVR